MKAKNLGDVKIANKNLIYQYIRNNKDRTVAEIEENTRLSHPTVTGLVRVLEQEGLIKKNGFGIPSGGRAPALYRINPNLAYAMGIDLEFPHVRMTVCDLEGRILCSSNLKYPEESRKDQVITLLLRQAAALIDKSAVAAEQLLGIGVGVPGIIDRKSKCSIKLERIRGWENVAIGRILEDAFHRPVYISNDVDLLSLAEKEYGNADVPADMLYIAIRRGIGMAIWTNGHIFSGEGGNAGRLGHMLVNTEGPTCRCGSKGCLGLYTSESAIFRLYREYSGKTAQSVKEIIALADQDDGAALKTVENIAYYLGIGIVNMANLFDISQIMLSASFELSRILKLIEPTLAIRKQHTACRQIRVTAARLDESRYAMGGCLMVLNSCAAALSDLEAFAHSSPNLPPPLPQRTYV